MSGRWWEDLPVWPALAYAQGLATKVRKVKVHKDASLSRKRRARQTLDSAFGTVRSAYVAAHRKVAIAQLCLDNARRVVWIFRGRRAVRAAKRDLATAESDRERVEKSELKRLGRLLDGFADATVRAEFCHAALVTAREEARRADRNLPPRARLPILIRKQKGRCGICDRSLLPFLEDIQVDHIRPRSHEGTDDPDNLQAVHPRCNARKGARWEGTRKAQLATWAAWKLSAIRD